MAERTQIAKPTDALQVGARNDAAETRVEERIMGDPAIHALHEGTMEAQPRGLDSGPRSLPDSMDDMLSDPGERLPQGLRSDMEGAFGEGFGDVRLHTGPTAETTARALGTAAFVAGDHIGFGAGAYRPDLPQGRGVIAHELAHVSETRAGADQPGMVRGVGPFEFLARLFGGGTFSDAELSRFIGSLTAANYTPDYTFQTDNMAREIVNRGLHDASNHDADVQGTTLAEAADLRVRSRLIRHLLDGFSSGADQDAVLRILRDATQLEREQLVRDYGDEALLERFSGARQDELTTLIHGGTNAAGQRVRGTEQSKRDDMPLRWELNYNLRNAGSLMQGIRGLAVEEFKNKPASAEDFSDIRRNAFFREGVSARDLPMTASPQQHPKNEPGQANMVFWVIPAQRGLEGPYAVATRTPTPDVQYGPVSATENQKVEATLDVQLGAARIGDVTQGDTSTDTTQQTRGRQDVRGRVDRAGQTDREGAEQSLNVTDRTNDTFELSLGNSQGSVQAWQLELEWQNTVTRTREELLQLETSLGSSTTDETTTEVEIGANIGAEAAASLAAELGLELGVDLSLSSLGGGMLGPLLRRIPGAGRVLGAILELVEGANAGLSLNLSPTGSLRVTGGLDGRAGRLWREARTRNFQIGTLSSTTDTTANQDSVGGGAQVSGQDSQQQTAGARRQLDQGRDVARGRRRTRERERRRDTEIENRRVDTNERLRRRENASSVQVRRDTLVPVVRSSNLSFRVVRDEWGGVASQTAAPQPAAGQTQQQANEEE